MAKITHDIAASKAQLLDDPITVLEVEELARRRLPKDLYDYYACGADDQCALTRNIDAFSK
jgi:(S)-2-hydroxy-acid oxidase